MKKLRAAAATLAVMALAVAPIGIASASNHSQAGQHGNACGYKYFQANGHSGHHAGGLKIGSQHCDKTQHGGGGDDNGGDDDSGD